MRCGVCVWVGGSLSRAWGCTVMCSAVARLAHGWVPCMCRFVRCCRNLVIAFAFVLVALAVVLCAICVLWAWCYNDMDICIGGAVKQGMAGAWFGRGGGGSCMLSCYSCCCPEAVCFGCFRR